MPKTQTRKILAMVDGDMLSEADFLDAVKKLKEMLDKAQGANKDELKQISTAIIGKFTELKAEVQNAVLAAKEGLTQSEKAQVASIEGRLAAADLSIKERLAGLKDGKSPEMAAIITALSPLIPPPIPGSPDSSEDVRNKLELLEGDERLKIDAIKDLREELDKLRATIKKEGTMFAGGGGSMKIQQTILAPAEALNDTTTTFTFGQKPLIVVVNGANYREGHGWTWVSEQVVLDNPVGSQGDLYGII